MYMYSTEYVGWYVITRCERSLQVYQTSLPPSLYLPNLSFILSRRESGENPTRLHLNAFKIQKIQLTFWLFTLTIRLFTN